MKTDAFTEYYRDILQGHYDCVDRIVLNAYFRLAQSPGGFRTWWRRLHGTDDNLTNEALAQYAGRFARRIRAFAEKHHLPLINADWEDDKHKIGEAHIPKDPKFQGLFCIIVGRCPAPVRNVVRFGKGGIDIYTKKRNMPYVNHYSFHIMDKVWGHLTLKLCPHPPFNVQCVLNGHEYVERLARKRGLEFSKEENCFTRMADPSSLNQLAETMKAAGFERRLAEACERWIYTTCLCFALDLAEQERCEFRYAYSVYQMEYSHNLLFQRGRKMDELFQALIDRNRSALDLRSLKTIFGVKHRPYFRDGKGRAPRMEISVEQSYDLTIFRILFGKLMIKMYTKGERVLRSEVTIHNARYLKGGHGIDQFPAIVGQLQAMLERFLSVLQAVNAPFIDSAALEKWPKRSQWKGRPIAGVDMNKPRTKAIVASVTALAPNPKGFKASELVQEIRTHEIKELKTYKIRHASYDLKKLAAKGVVRRIDNTLRYEVVSKGLREARAVVILMDEVLKPLLSNSCKRRRGPKCYMTASEVHFDNIQQNMQQIFKLYGIAA